jgi:hypothetical protein
MRLFLPRTASSFCSLSWGDVDLCIETRFSSSCETIDTGASCSFLLSVGNIPWKTAEGSGGLGVQGRVPGLVKPPSLVKSVIALLLLHVEIHDIPRTGLRSECSSTGEFTFEFDLRAEVRSDSLRSRIGFDFTKEDVDECRVKGAGR